MNKPTEKKRVVVGMSGGVDSSVAAALLLEKGFDVIGITMKTYNFDEVGGNIGNESSCCGIDAFNDARMVAVSLGIPHYVLDFTEKFGREVVDNFAAEYTRGRTPNPCIICNGKIKWGEMLNKAEALGADYIATGHYARVFFDDASKRYIVERPRDLNKDQTYALWGLSQAALSKTIFPLGELTKPMVRELASKYGLNNAAKSESFEICFVPDDDYRRFLKSRGVDSRSSAGDILMDGKVVGKHDGVPFYTIGQRSGIGAHGERVYVTAIDPVKNTVKIGRGSDLMHKSLIAADVNLVSAGELSPGMKIQAQIRYKDTPSPALVFPETDGRIRVLFDEPKRAITPGQSVVMYSHQRLVGGGVIGEVAD